MLASTESREDSMVASYVVALVVYGIVYAFGLIRFTP